MSDLIPLPPQGTINAYTSHGRTYLRYSWRKGRKKTHHKHLGAIDDPVAIDRCDLVRELQANGKSVPEILARLE